VICPCTNVPTKRFIRENQRLQIILRERNKKKGYKLKTNNK